MSKVSTKARVNTEITTATQTDSITPNIVGTILDEIIELNIDSRFGVATEDDIANESRIVDMVNNDFVLSNIKDILLGGWTDNQYSSNHVLSLSASQFYQENSANFNELETLGVSATFSSYVGTGITAGLQNTSISSADATGATIKINQDKILINDDPTDTIQYGVNNLGISYNQTGNNSSAQIRVQAGNSGEEITIQKSHNGDGIAILLPDITPSQGNLIKKLPISVNGEFADAAGNITLSVGYIVANLPAGTIGQRAYVTDANATTFYSVVAGGGANVVPVFFNGTNWVIA